MNHNQLVGKFGEKIAEEYLERKGYKILDRNIKTSYQEIDIIAEKQKRIIFVEVKTRTSSIHGYADESLDRRKMINLKKAVNYYLINENLYTDEIGVDLVAVDISKKTKTAKIKHYHDIV
ncbi:YraN family protein [Patescibacteria group bacterium]